MATIDSTLEKDFSPEDVYVGISRRFTIDCFLPFLGWVLGWADFVDFVLLNILTLIIINNMFHVPANDRNKARSPVASLRRGYMSKD